MINIEKALKEFPGSITIYNLLLSEGGEARFIGGMVRDIMFGREVSDVDIATDILPDKVESILKTANIHYVNIGKKFGTITAIINQQKIEITTLRKDLSCDGRHAIVEYTDDWQEDAQRRDFTVNAMSSSLDGKIYDYFGGIKDLQQGRVRFIGNAEDRVKEDFLRILRFFRFSSYFANTIDEQGLKACKKYASKLETISANRFRSEMSKIFLSKNSIKTLYVMQVNGILKCSSDSIMHLENIYKLMDVFAIEHKEILFLSILLRSYNNPNDIISNSAFTARESKLLNLLVYTDISKYDFDSLKENWQKYKYNFKDAILVNIAVNNIEVSKNLKKNLNEIFSKEIITLPISGKDLAEMGVVPGKEMGELLAIAEKLWYKSEFKISKEELISNLKKELL